MFSQYSFSNIGHSLCSIQIEKCFYALCNCYRFRTDDTRHNAGIEKKRVCAMKKLLNEARLGLGTLGSPREGGPGMAAFIECSEML